MKLQREHWREHWDDISHAAVEPGDARPAGALGGLMALAIILAIAVGVVVLASVGVLPATDPASVPLIGP